MSKEIVKFMCPACGHGLREEQYYNACEELRAVAHQIGKQIAQEYVSDKRNDA